MLVIYVNSWLNRRSVGGGQGTAANRCLVVVPCPFLHSWLLWLGRELRKILKIVILIKTDNGFIIVRLLCIILTVSIVIR
jgi:hypothetical protein